MVQNRLTNHNITAAVVLGHQSLKKIVKLPVSFILVDFVLQWQLFLN